MPRACDVTLNPVPSFVNPLIMGAVGTAVELIIAFNAMPDYATATVEAGGRKCLNRALKAVERIALPFHDDVKALVIVVATYLADSHGSPRKVFPS